ncbi:MAG: methyltransferase domain-containing protein [Candidatus Lokiarchaeota archaeon]|nr:methyltransferase domain-containing protein [Candidatus Lokiarchaeota archaeon]MBD3201901.1 methyltransferase domain-containing protein [Candidatus Lokiarchaeota archaeon]
MTPPQSIRYVNIYNNFIYKFYDLGLKIGLTPIGEKILRYSVYEAISPYIKKGDTILDLCCGTGTLTILITKLIYRECIIFGVDLSRGQIFQAQKKNQYPNLNFLVMDAFELKFPDEYFEHIIISAALHEMRKSQRLKVLSEVFRVLKKGGRFIIFEHHEPSKIFHRLLYNFYLGFIEKITSNSAEMQREILKELKLKHFLIKTQMLVNRFFNFFQIIHSIKI